MIGNLDKILKESLEEIELNKPKISDLELYFKGLSEKILNERGIISMSMISSEGGIDPVLLIRYDTEVEESIKGIDKIVDKIKEIIG